MELSHLYKTDLTMLRRFLNFTGQLFGNQLEISYLERETIIESERHKSIVETSIYHTTLLNNVTQSTGEQTKLF